MGACGELVIVELLVESSSWFRKVFALPVL